MSHLSILYIIFAIVTIIILSPFVNERSFNNGKHINEKCADLPDIIHDSLNIRNEQQLTAIGKASDHLFTIVITITFIVLLLFRRDLLFFFIALLLTLKLVAMIIISATTLPNCGKPCVHSKTIIEEMLNMGSCNNLGMSSHLVNTGLSLYFLSWITNHKYWAIFAIIYTTQFFLITAAKNHYTIDCIVSTLVLAILLPHVNTIYHNK